MNQKRETDLREDLRFLLARSGVSGFTRPDEFDLCGCCCCEAPRFDRTIRVRWSHSLAHLRPNGRRDALFRHYNPLHVDRPWRSKVRLRLCLRLGLESLESVEDDPWPRFIDGNPISKYVTFAVLFVNLYMATWYMVPMPPMIDTYDLKLFYTLYTYNSIKWFVLNVSSILGYYKVETLSSGLRCIVWWELGLIIASFFFI